MGLDKWLKSEDKEKKQKKKKEAPDQKVKRKIEEAPKKSIEKPLMHLAKYILICPNAKCKYQKTIMKKELTDNDITCPRCNKKMKTKVK